MFWSQVGTLLQTGPSLVTEGEVNIFIYQTSPSPTMFSVSCNTDKHKFCWKGARRQTWNKGELNRSNIHS